MTVPAPTAPFPELPAVDPAALHESASGLRRLASRLDDAATVLRAVASSVSGTVWTGRATDAWVEQAGAVCADLHRGVPSLTDATGAANRLADSAADARAAYTGARQDYDAAVAAHDAAATAAAGGAVHAAAAATAGGQATSDAAAAGGRAAAAMSAAGDDAAGSFAACTGVAGTVGHVVPVRLSDAQVTGSGDTGVTASWSTVLLGTGAVTLAGLGGNGGGDEGREAPGGGEHVWVGGLDRPAYGDWEGPFGEVGHGGYISSAVDDADEPSADSQPPIGPAADEPPEASNRAVHHQDDDQWSDSGTAQAEEEAGRSAFDFATRPSKLEHLFEPKHNFDALVRRFGSREAVVQQFLDGLRGITPESGVFERRITVGDQAVTVRGAVVNGVIKLGTAFTP